MAKNSGNSKIHIRGTASRGSLYDSQNWLMSTAEYILFFQWEYS
jgi:hypothetical protein